MEVATSASTVKRILFWISVNLYRHQTQHHALVHIMGAVVLWCAIYITATGVTLSCAKHPRAVLRFWSCLPVVLAFFFFFFFLLLISRLFAWALLSLHANLYLCVFKKQRAGNSVSLISFWQVLTSIEYEKYK